MNIRFMRWVVFAAALCGLHFAFWVFVTIRDIASHNGHTLLGIFIVILFGPLTCAKCAIGYALIDSALGARGQAALWYRYNPLMAGVLAAPLFLVGLSLREVLPSLFNNLADSYFIGNWFAFGGPVLVGALSGALTAVVGISVNWRRRIRSSRLGEGNESAQSSKPAV
jgi:hypothetical protein